MFFVVVSAGAFENSGIEYTISEDGNSVSVTGCTPDIVVDGSLTIPSEVEYSGKQYPVTGIGASAFADRTDLYMVQFSRPVRLTTIGESAFKGCSNLNRTSGNAAVGADSGFFVIPSTVRNIGASAFENCGIVNLMLLGSERENDNTPSGDYKIGSSAFAGNKLSVVGSDYVNPPVSATDAFGDNANGAALYVPDKSVDAYKAAAGWSAFGNNILVGVEETGVDPAAGVYSVYNLHGVCVMRTEDVSLPGLPKGVYIVNGRKIMK